MNGQALLYIIVIPICCLLFSRLRNFRSRQVLLLLMSYFLYSSWGLGFLGILVLSSLLNYWLGFRLRRKQSAATLWLGIVANITMLIAFKYLPAIMPLLRRMSIGTFANSALPVGISFWTLQALSYLFDLYRGEDMEPSLLEFLLYMAFWPTVLSGPICRLSSLLSQFRKTSKQLTDDVQCGLDRISIGLVMTALGQVLASGVHPGQGLDAIFDKLPSRLAGPDVWCVAIGYGFELFLNFAGYSHIVIGAARLFAIHLDENFDRPYFATSPSEFWTRWHMSLSFWIRDYLFLPVAMLRPGKWWRSFSLVLSMVVFGFWHKASLLFLVWGLYHGLLLVLHRQWQELRRRMNWHFSQVIIGPTSWLITFGAICLGWMFFRVGTFSQALAMLRAAVSLVTYSGHVLSWSLYLVVLTVVVAYFGTVNAGLLRRRHGRVLAIPQEFRFALYAVAVYVGVLHTAQTQAFIYSKF